MPTKVLNYSSQHEKLTRRPPNYSHPRVFGCTCRPHVRPRNSNKLDYRIQRCIFLGYSSSLHGYICYNPHSKKVISCHVVFNEEFPFDLDHSAPSNPNGMSPYIFPIPNLSLPPSLPTNTSFSPSLSPTDPPSSHPHPSPTSSPLPLFPALFFLRPLVSLQTLILSSPSPTSVTILNFINLFLLLNFLNQLVLLHSTSLVTVFLQILSQPLLIPFPNI